MANNGPATTDAATAMNPGSMARGGQSETARRRSFFRGLNKWSPTVIDGVAQYDIGSAKASWWVDRSQGDATAISGRIIRRHT